MSNPISSLGRVAFIVERPLQVMIAHAICLQLNIPPAAASMLVANRFAGAPKVVKRLAEIGGYNAKLFTQYHLAMRFARKTGYRTLFIHWDMGFRTQFILWFARLLNPGMTIAVFEEGVGTYRTDVYKGVKRYILGKLGFPLNVGGSVFCDVIYVYDPPRYVKSVARSPASISAIRPPLADTIARYRGYFIDVFDEGGLEFFRGVAAATECSCEIYLSGWRFSDGDVIGLFSEGSFSIVKLHPYCVDKVRMPGAHVAPSGLPAELMIAECSRKFDSVLVYHHGSSVQQYITFENVEFRRVAHS